VLPFTGYADPGMCFSPKFMRAFLPLGMIGAFLASVYRLLACARRRHAFLRLAPAVYNWAIFFYRYILCLAGLETRLTKKTSWKIFLSANILVNSNMGL
jgi:hypothetical protein